jgi:hypothetical protein
MELQTQPTVAMLTALLTETRPAPSSSSPRVIAAVAT